MPTFTEVLPATKSSPHAALTWTPDQSRPGCGVLRIDSARCSCRYRVSPLPTGWEGKAFTFEKLDTAGETYSVFCHRARQDNLCDCKGFTYAGHCKHVAAAFALIENGWDELPAEPAPIPAECPF